MAENNEASTFGLALSGGGSRAAAFHRGTLRALLELGLVPRVDVVSTVSGGSVFGAAWMTALAREQSHEQFLESMGAELERGFIGRSLGLGVLKMAVPFLGYSRSSLIADTFDRIFFEGGTLEQLPESPRLCINTTVMNNGQVGKFTRQGFSAWGLKMPGGDPEHQALMPDYRLADAVAASAAFPVGLPPVMLERGETPRPRCLPPKVEFLHDLEGAKVLALTDGGVLENLGVQTLLQSERFGCWDMVVSDAGTREEIWKPGSWLNPIMGIAAALVSFRIIAQVMLIMNNKENRWARKTVIDELYSSWMAESLRADRRTPALDEMLSQRPDGERRKVLFVRVSQKWDRMMSKIPRYRLVELAEQAGKPSAELPDRRDAATVQHFLEAMDVDLTPAARHYEQLGGEQGADEANAVGTNFTGLSTRQLSLLEHHAAWQVHATHAIFGL